MDDWDLYALRNQLDSINAAQNRTNIELENLNSSKYVKTPRDKLFSSKLKTVLIVAAIFFGIGTIGQIGMFVFMLFLQWNYFIIVTSYDLVWNIRAINGFVHIITMYISRKDV